MWVNCTASTIISASSQELGKVRANNGFRHQKIGHHSKICVCSHNWCHEKECHGFGTRGSWRHHRSWLHCNWLCKFFLKKNDLIYLYFKTKIDFTFFLIFQELSGLGSRKRLNASEIENRFNNTSNVAKTRSIISFGLSMFKYFKNESVESEFTFHVQTFNILSLCSDDYIVEPASVKFLVEHGFDFNRQYSEGLSYFRGNDKVTKVIV